ncbi:MAG: class I SAM-dependent methyltransferase [Firmicutes bacterium]|nr:class I SAM-dependent methyltransferase [Bacillota bacterium]
MKQYGGLAALYDYLVGGVDFNGWIDYLEEILASFGHAPATVLDLACGTGNTVLPVARRGYRACGVDLSPEMIELARAKAAAEGLNVEFWVEDMRHFTPPIPVDLVTCFHDGLNYLTAYSDLVETFRCVRRSLNRGGLFVFDLNAVRWLNGAKPGATVVEVDDFTIIYESAYHREADLWEIHLTCFVREGELYRKFTEVHREKAYRIEEVVSGLSEAGLTLLGCYDPFTLDPPSEQSKRHFFVARKM